MNQLYSISTLSNGLRVICRQTDSLVSYIGIVVDAGSRDEDDSRHGLAHFVEHTIFKGTDSRKGWQISSRMEVVGGELNAYTSKEETMVYTNAPAGYEERAVELLADIVTSSRFPKEEIDREREVVVEEIKSYLDSPADSVYDEFEEAAYAGSGLAHNILG
ncbi:MAG: insulinase family protein, partial [Muribaculaceae bacterium]|nr:insulinase family protein [Muribaculaceae bacterium]